MNLWWILLLTLPVLGLLLFGKNPIREYQKNQAALMEKYGGDELTIKANIYAEHKKKAGGGGSYFGGGGETAPQDMNESQMKAAIQSSSSPIDPEFRFRPLISNEESSPSVQFGGSKATKVAKPDDNFPDDFSGSVEVKQRGNGTGTPQSNGSALSAVEPVPEKKSSYYPPLVTEYKAVVAVPKVALTGREARLRSGQVIIFEGTSVYYVNESGGKSYMPNGKYILEDGRHITVNSGQNISSD